MAEQPNLFDSPAGDRPASPAYQPGTWLTEPGPDDGDQETNASTATTGHRFAEPDRRLLHRLLEAERLFGFDLAGNG
jgi:hypothetical protein